MQIGHEGLGCFCRRSHVVEKSSGQRLQKKNKENTNACARLNATKTQASSRNPATTTKAKSDEGSTEGRLQENVPCHTVGASPGASTIALEGAAAPTQNQLRPAASLSETPQCALQQRKMMGAVCTLPIDRRCSQGAMSRLVWRVCWRSRSFEPSQSIAATTPRPCPRHSAQRQTSRRRHPSWASPQA